MNVAIVRAAGSCGRQLAAQLLDRRLLPASARLQLVGHLGGRSADALRGLRADLEDAFADAAPSIDVVLDPSGITADLVLMLAGATVSTDPNATIDRAALGESNYRMFVEVADALAARSGPSPVVVVQSNPVELGVLVFAQHGGRSASWVPGPGRTPCASAANRPPTWACAGRRCRRWCSASTATMRSRPGSSSRCRAWPGRRWTPWCGAPGRGAASPICRRRCGPTRPGSGSGAAGACPRRLRAGAVVPARPACGGQTVLHPLHGGPHHGDGHRPRRGRHRRRPGGRRAEGSCRPRSCWRGSGWICAGPAEAWCPAEPVNPHRI